MTLRTWKVTLPKSEPTSCTVAAFDERDALEIAAERLGIALVPCCELGEEPCEKCTEGAARKAYERAEQMGKEARRED